MLTNSSLTNEFFYLYSDTFISPDIYLFFNDYSFLFYFWNQSPFDFFTLYSQSTPYTKSIISYINQFEDLNLFNNSDNISAIYHYSIPNTKLAYPEPFIASPSFMHSDIWFVHILVYQYWLWFVFIFIIVFFFITFICTVRWCNMRVKPRRETRGVSRSKCGDLITACVPVTWATSIIVNESTDAIDYFDGFGTTELVVGIRAYQWGWEYYYPKDIDLNYNIKQNYSSFIGNSLKYSKTTETNLRANNMWRFYQNKISDQIITPAHVLVLPLNNSKLLSFINVNDFGINTAQEPNSFKRVREFSKISNLDFLSFPNNFSINYKTLSTLYVNNLIFTDSYLYGLKRQHNYLSINSTLNNRSTLFNTNNFLKILTYNNRNSFFNVNKINSDSILLNNKVTYGFNKNNLNMFFKNIQLVKMRNQKITENLILKKTYNHLFNQNLIKNNNLFGRNNFYNFQINKKNLLSNNWARLNLLNFYQDYPYSPIKNTRNELINLNAIDNVPNFFKKKIAIRQNPFDFKDKWNFFTSNSISDWRFYNLYHYYNTFKFFYFPLFNFYYDYDFRNWQSIEFLEDFFWESTDSVYLYDEYVGMRSFFENYSYYSNIENMFNFMNKLIIFKEKIATIPFFLNNMSDEIFSNPIYLDDFITIPNTLTTKDFFILPISTALNSLDDSYETLKFLNYLSNLTNKTIKLINTNTLSTHTYSQVFDFYRSDIDEFSWFFDENFSNHADVFDFLNINEETLNQLQLINSSNISNLTYYTFNNEISDFLELPNNSNTEKSTRFSNHLNIRSPVKNSIVTHNAILKIFRARFDENRSNTKLYDFSRSAVQQPLITANRTPYEKILGKTKENFFQINLYKNSFKPLITNLHAFHSSLNYYFFDFPFLLAMKSDASRYLWFDWFTKWGFYEIQPSSSSRYAIYGMPYFSKNFEFSTSETESLMESETYFLRLARARKNYIPNWTYTPYFYTRNSYWYTNNIVYSIFNQLTNQLAITYNLLQLMNWYWTGKSLINTNINNFNPSHSNVNNFVKLGWKPSTMAQSYYYTAAAITDILTKREFLYREFFSYKKKIINLPSYLTNNPSNPLLDNLKASFLFIDPINISTEYTRDNFVLSSNLFNSTILKTILLTNSYVNLKFVSDYLFYFLSYNNVSNLIDENYLLQKSQYRPLRKGINNMIRLHATGAVAMPIEIRLQVLASSKDVIHSWAIPSAGIKIDCVPGYSSHKVMIFLVSGIFWGQCMEICGRYHHWMPIIIYFMKRDLFFLWCTHFVFLTGANNMWTINDRPYTDYVRLASFDKYSWLTELISENN